MKLSRQLPPKAGILMEALRGLGYSTATAIADLIDNSIAAGATRVWLDFKWQEAQTYVQLLDNGRGMTEDELVGAMQLGGRSPLDKRELWDLGRFGLGLKTASFSQCRLLTVASRKMGNTSCFRWDLDELTNAQDAGWHLLEGAEESSEGLLSQLDVLDSGTLVLWQRLDRIVAKDYTLKSFLDLIDNVELHLAMVFHRYLGPNKELEILINGRPIKPWDPFLDAHPATIGLPELLVPSREGDIKIQGYVLPHKDKLDPEVHERAAGPDGWTAQQGFYVYRNKRLLVAGSWLGLGTVRAWSKEEAFRLARISVEIPNSADIAWKIDIRKSVARPPVSLKPHLIKVAEETREKARRVFAHRGKYALRGELHDLAQTWIAEHFSGGIRYKIDRNHPVINAVIENAGSLLPQIKAMLRVIEETVPVQRIWLDTADNKETPRTNFADVPSSEVKEVLNLIIENLVERQGLSPDLACRQLLYTEPFSNFRELVTEVTKDYVVSQSRR